MNWDDAYFRVEMLPLGVARMAQNPGAAWQAFSGSRRLPLWPHAVPASEHRLRPGMPVNRETEF